MSKLKQTAFHEDDLKLVEGRNEGQIIRFAATTRVGDIVYLKSGSPKLTVKRIKTQDNIDETEVTCSWMGLSYTRENTATFFAPQLSNDCLLERS